MLDKMAQHSYNLGAQQAIEDLTKEAGIADWFAKTNPISRALTGTLGGAMNMGAYGGITGAAVGGPVGAGIGAVGGAGIGALMSLLNRAIHSRAALGRAAQGYKPLAHVGDSEAKILDALQGKKSVWPF